MAEKSDNPQRAERILDAANKLFSYYGYDKTTVGEIAEEAGISKGAIYLHWKSKEDLFEALIFREGEKLIVDMVARIEADPEAGSIFSLYQYSILAIMDNPLMHALVTRDTRVVGDFIERWNKSGLIAESNIFRADFVRQLQAANVIRKDLDTEAVSYILNSLRYGMFTIRELMPASQTPPLPVVGKVMAEMLERALTPDDGGDRAAGKKTLEILLEGMRQMMRKFASGTVKKDE